MHTISHDFFVFIPLSHGFKHNSPSLSSSSASLEPQPVHDDHHHSSTSSSSSPTLPTPTPTPMSTPTPFLPLLVLLPFLSSALPSSTSSSSFSFPRFDHTPSLYLLGDAHLSPPSTITMTTGAILHRDPLPFGRMPSFSSNLSFSISPSGTSPLLALALVLSPDPTPSSHPGAFSVELRPLTSSTPWKKLRSWVDFDGRRKLLEVRLSNAANARPSEPALAYATDLTGAIWREQMFVGLLSSGGNSTRVVTVYDWSFEVRSAAPYRMHSEPLDPSALAKKPLEEQEQEQQQQQQEPTTVGAGGKTRRRERDHGVLDVVVMVLMVGAACGAAVAFLVAFGWLGIVERRRIAPAERALPSLGFEYEKISALAEKGSESAGGKVVVV